MASEARAALTIRAIDLATVVVSRLGPWILLAAAAYYLRGAVVEAAQEKALWPAWLRMLTRLNQVRAFGFIFGLLGLVYGIRERELRRAAVKRLSERNRELEGLLEQRGGGGR